MDLGPPRRVGRAGGSLGFAAFARMRQLSSASEMSWNVESALHDFERRMRELRRVVHGLSKDVENYQDFIRPHLRDRWGFPLVDAALMCASFAVRKPIICRGVSLRNRIDCSTVSVFTVRILAPLGIARSQSGGPRTDRPRTLGLARDSLHHGGEIGEVVFEEFHQLGAPSLWPTCLPSLTASKRAADQGQTAKEDDGQARRRDGHEAVVRRNNYRPGHPIDWRREC